MLYATILAWMLSLQPLDRTPWADTFAETALEIDLAAHANPVYRGDARQTAALITSIAWFEGRFRPDAIGDSGDSVCMMQIGVSNLREFQVTRDEMLTSRATCFGVGLQMISTSMHVCRGRPLDDLLGHYASGGGSCGGTGAVALDKSKHRVELARRLLQMHDTGS